MADVATSAAEINYKPNLFSSQNSHQYDDDKKISLKKIAFAFDAAKVWLLIEASREFFSTQFTPDSQLVQIHASRHG